MKEGIFKIFFYKNIIRNCLNKKFIIVNNNLKWNQIQKK